MLAVTSVGKQSGLNPPGLAQALLLPQVRPFLMVSLGHAQGFPMVLYAATEAAMIKTMIAASVRISVERGLA